MNTINLTFTNATTEKSGYGEPIIDVKSDKVITVINRGYNHFEPTDTINADMLNINELCIFSKEHGIWDTYKGLLRITMPNGKIKHVGYEWQHQAGNGYDNIKRILNW